MKLHQTRQHEATRFKSSSVAFRLRSFGVVDAALNTQIGDAITILNGRYAPPPVGGDVTVNLDGEVVVDPQGVFTNLGIGLREMQGRMVAAKTVQLGQLARTVALQERRSSLTQGLFNVS